ncbi:minor capsid protein [Streptococcus cuniculipharyngis]|uniref:Phage head morphogenesis protein n=1 Tax=Streptococcus cuniculipharyngis TaxID=1562651 RepID=A0A5C5SGW2_9STRE|nr:minor capsid protein [Streptococcus cuniculipharyngis]TWS99151.1 phage head morphogenesis protein [Streptococcus cuniculipharyngis]
MTKKKQAHLDYWRARSEAIFRYVDQTDLDVFAELSKLYTEQAVAMQKDLYQFVLTYAENGQMSYREALERLRKVDLSDYQENAKRYFEQAKEEKDLELLERLNEQYVAARANRMDLLHLEMTYRLGRLSRTLQGTFETYLKKTAKYAYRKAMVGSASLDDVLLKALVETPFDGQNYSQQLWANTDKLAKDLRDVLKCGFIRGDSVKTMAQDIANKYNIARSRAQTLIRTDGTAIVNRAAIQRYKDAGLTYYRDSVHLDERTTAICREVARKNELKRIDEMVIGVNAAPYHYNCRTAVIPEVDESDERLDNTSDKVYNETMKSSGAVYGAWNDRNDPYSKERDRHAEMYYEQVRNRDKTLEIARVARNSSFSQSEIEKIYNHVFINEYNLHGGIQRFDPSYDMAESWRRLSELAGKNIQSHDIIMLHHELGEYLLMQSGLSYEEAHAKINQDYNYYEALKAWQRKRGDL